MNPTSRPASTTTTRRGPGGGRSTTSCWARPAVRRARAGWWSVPSRTAPAARPQRGEVEIEGGGSTTTFATPDPAQPDGFYILYAESGPQDLEASLAGYQPDADSTTVVPGGTQRVDFRLLVGQPLGVHRRSQRPREPGRDRTATVHDHQHRSGGRQLRAPGDQCSASQHPDPRLRCGFAASAGAARLPQGGKDPEHTARSTQGLAPLPNRRPAAPRVADAGATSSRASIRKSPSGGAWRRTWARRLADEHRGGGRRRSRLSVQRRRLADGQHDRPRGHRRLGRGRTIDLTTGNLWKVAVGGDNCIYELNSTTFEQTGNTICGSPWTGTSQRGSGL